MKSKGVLLAIIGLGIMCFGLGFMLYSVNSETSSWGTGYAILGVGFFHSILRFVFSI